jgi:hypothetical protein
MRCVTFAATLVVLVFVSIALPAEPQEQTVPQDPSLAASTFQAAINAWAHNEYWRLHAMGSKESRAALSETDFVERMGKGTSKPGIGLEILEVRIAGFQALIQAKVRMEYSGFAPYGRSRPSVAGSADETIQVILVHQEGEWRINLHQFVGMSGYY